MILEYAKAPPWGTTGRIVEGATTAAEAIQNANLDWQVQKWPLMAVDMGWQQWESPVAYQEVPVKEHFAVMRMDNKKVLGIVGGRYEPIQNRDAFSFFDVAAQEEELVYETVGQLGGGRKLWVLARMPQVGVIKHLSKAEDLQKRYIALVTSHDGKGSLIGYFTNVRVACWNAIRRSIADAGFDKVHIRHTFSAKDKLLEAGRVLSSASSYFESAEDVPTFLASKPVRSEKEFKSFIDLSFPKRDDDKGWKVDKMREAAMTNWLQEEELFGADWFSAVNAATGVIDHSQVASGREERKVDSILFGTGMAHKNRIYNAALYAA